MCLHRSGEAGCSQRTVTCLQRVLSLYTLWDVAASFKQAPQSICSTGRKQDASYGAHIRQGCNYAAQLLQAARPTALSKSHCPVLCKSHCPVTAQWDWDCQWMRKALRKLGLEPQCQYNAWQPAMTECPGTSASSQSLYPFLATVALPVWRAFLLLAEESPRKLGAP